MNLSIGLWNVQWASRDTARGAIITRRLGELSAHVLCITEGNGNLLPDDGHVISSAADYGYRLIQGRRKVLLWSRRPWRDVDTVGSPGLPPGRFVAGTTDTPCGVVRFLGICVPWRDAHVQTGQRNRRPWENHLAYLNHLPPIFQADRSVPTVVLGDFNQRVPRVGQPQRVYAALTAALAPDYRLVTAGHIAGAPGPGVDHVAVRGALEPVRIEYQSANNVKGKRMSDHFGLRVLFNTQIAP